MKPQSIKVGWFTGILIGLVSGIALGLTYPLTIGYGYQNRILEAGQIWPLAFIAFVPMFWLFDGRGTKASIFLAISVFSVIHIMCVFYWLSEYTLAPAFILGFSMPFINLVWAISISAAMRRLPRAHLLWMIPTAMVVCDFKKYLGFWAAPLMILPFSQNQNPMFIQIADIFGSAGITFEIVLVNLCIYFLINETSVRLRLAALGIAMISLMMVYGYGYVQMRRYNAEAIKYHAKENHIERGVPQRVALIQAGYGELVEWTPDYVNEAMRAYCNRAINTISPKSIDIIFMPEVSIPRGIDLSDVTKDIPEYVKGTARMLKCSIVYGTYGYKPMKNAPSDWRGEKLNQCLKEGSVKLFNSLIAVGPDGSYIGSYLKNRPVPFGECLPVGGFMKFIKYPWKFGDFEASGQIEPLSTQSSLVATGICIENLYPYIYQMQTSQDTGADLLLSSANNAWFNTPAAMIANYHPDRFRAIENRRFMVRVVTSGISMIIDPAGNVITQSSINSRTTLRETIFNLQDRTIYTQFGEWFGYLCLILWLFSIVFTIEMWRRQTGNMWAWTSLDFVKNIFLKRDSRH